MTTPTTSSDLSDLVGALQREVAVPGAFSTTFPNTAASDLQAKLGDAFGQAQLDGFFGQMALDVDAGIVTPQLSSAGGAVLILYAAESIIRSQLRVLKTKVDYEAAGAKYDVEQAASVLTQELKDLTARRTQLLANILRQMRAGQAVFVSDGYLTRAFGYWPWGYRGEFPFFNSYELPGIFALGF